MTDPNNQAGTEQTTSGVEDMKNAKAGASIDYNEETTPNNPPAEEKPQENKEAQENQAALKNARLVQEALRRQEISEREALKAKAESDLLKQQMAAVAGVQQQQQEKEISKEELNELMQTDPVEATRIITEQTARKVKAETLKELEQTERTQQASAAFEQKKQQFAANVDKVNTENKELADPNHELTKIYMGLESEFPWLLQDPEGPNKAIKMAKERYDLARLRKGELTPEQIKEAETRGKEAEAARNESAAVASMVSGPNRSAPPATSVKLTDEQKLAARKMRLTPEEYGKYLSNNPQTFQKEETPRKRKN